MEKYWHKDGSMGCRLLLFAACIGILAFLLSCGCGIEKTDGTKVSDLEYEMTEEENVPKELAAKIEEKKEADFKLTYESGDDLYIARGYGEQETGGYSIQILELYLTQNAAVFDTNLIGPSKDDAKNTSPSYPYIVVRVKNPKKNVIFR